MSEEFSLGQGAGIGHAVFGPLADPPLEFRSMTAFGRKTAV